MLNEKKRKRIRKTVQGSSLRPRLSIYRSHQHIYAQIIDDSKGCTLVQSSTLDKEVHAQIKSGATQEASTLVGQSIASRAIAKGLDKVVFDRGGKLYHGRIKALAEAARETGLIF
uniref:ribosomal protein L18 n=1 Tax=Rhodaphanes brevistipitata TaxID=446136 RepID=UPI001FCCF2B6|nr:ribosomal protein L18 [Rhodaphanes brevistipitata]UNJ18456.1 ribosomal protein L18 [Rhodaphanes brevistipitata]